MKHGYNDDSAWISTADLMSGLMVIFLFISIAYMVSLETQKATTEKLVYQYESSKKDIYHDLETEFKDDLERYGARLDEKTLTITFVDGETLFAPGSDELNLTFSKTLSEFLPRYIKILHKEQFRDTIEEIRIEGHTSSEWVNAVSPDDAYFHNMVLSQARTRSVLQYLVRHPQLENYREWMKKKITANGLSSSHLKLDAKGDEDREMSRRVEFRIVTNSAAIIEKINNTTK